MRSFLFIFYLFYGFIFSIEAQKGLYLPNNQGGTTLAQNEHRVALLIGNANYDQNWPNLAAPVKDVQLIAKSLNDCGFDTEVLTDANRSDMLEAINDFIEKIDNEETVALLYFAGHGAEFDGTNFLIPIDDKASCRTELSDYSVTLNSVHDKLEQAGAAMSILLVDACRTQALPFTCVSDTRGDIRRGFVEYEPSGSFVSFSTSPGAIALDRQAGKDNSPYAIALSKALRQRGLKIEDVFKRVSRSLARQGQEPWVRNNYYGDFFFKPKKEKQSSKLDSDGDGLVDAQDNCPNQYGDIVNYGCPKQEAIRDNFTAYVGETSFKMNYLPGSAFNRGSEDGGKDEQPVREIKLNDFYISKYEVTVGEYLAFCGAVNDHWPEWLMEESQYNIRDGLDPFYSDKGYALEGSERMPIVGVSWNDAVAYCKWLSEETGKTYRLPTEAEWEYAAKAGRGGALNEERAKRHAWFRENAKSRPHEVGRKKANAYGLNDMLGNVWEWCADSYSSTYYESSPAEQPVNKDTTTEKVIRGGDWNSSLKSCSPNNRYSQEADNRNANTGFRVVCELE